MSAPLFSADFELLYDSLNASYPRRAKGCFSCSLASFRALYRELEKLIEMRAHEPGGAV